MAVMFFAAMLFMIIGCVGLAVDVGTIFMVKARLSAAADAAALAAGRSVNLASTLTEAQSNAVTTANQFFTANFPNGYFNTIGAPTVTPTLAEENDVNGNADGILDFKVTASVAAPTYFMNIFNVHSVTVTASGTASRRGLVAMLVLDISSSMNTSSVPTACTNMIAAAQNFLTLLSPYDEVGLITFETTVHLMDTPTTDRTQVTSDIGSITCKNNTNTISALDVAYQQIKATNLPLALNTIILFTDGSPNGITAEFPARDPSTNESRWGPASTTPAQSGSTFGITNACGFAGFVDPVADSYTDAICINMPVICSNSSAILFGNLAQWGAESYYGGYTNGLVAATDAAGARTIDGYDTSTVSYPASCNPGSGVETLYIRQYIAYIPNTDIYGNDLVNGVPATGSSSYGTVTGGYDTRKNWIYKVNQECNGGLCAYTGGPWSSFPTYVTGSNFFPSTNSLYSNAKYYAGHLRPDQPNTIVAASMNGAMAEAFTIRADNTYNPVIDTIYLTGNGSEAVDREFLAIVANSPNIPALPYDTGYAPPPNDPVLYANPAYRTDQATGAYLVTADSTTLTNMFAQIASQALRLSH
jgi:Flp pilus assembly protein TadG